VPPCATVLVDKVELVQFVPSEIKIFPEVLGVGKFLSVKIFPSSQYKSPLSLNKVLSLLSGTLLFKYIPPDRAVKPSTNKLHTG